MITRESMPLLLAETIGDKARLEKENARLSLMLERYVKAFNDLYYHHAGCGCAACQAAGRLIAEQIKDRYSVTKRA